MKFNEFWNKISKKTSGGVRFQTWHRKLPFTATYSSGKIIVKPEEIGREERPLSSKEFQKVWVIAETLPPHEVFRRKNYPKSFHASYIIAMMKEILGEEKIGI